MKAFELNIRDIVYNCQDLAVLLRLEKYLEYIGNREGMKYVRRHTEHIAPAYFKGCLDILKNLSNTPVINTILGLSEHLNDSNNLDIKSNEQFIEIMDKRWVIKKYTFEELKGEVIQMCFRRDHLSFHAIRENLTVENYTLSWCVENTDDRKSSPWAIPVSLTGIKSFMKRNNIYWPRTEMTLLY